MIDKTTYRDGWNTIEQAIRRDIEDHSKEEEPAVSDQANSYQSGGDHYRRNRKFQTWEVIEEWVPLGMGSFEVYLWGNILKYLSRLGRKGSIDEDLAKAQHYLEKLQEVRNRPDK